MKQGALSARKLPELDGLFRGFADPTRLRVLNALAAGELCVCDIVELLRLPQPTISRHLAYLRSVGLVLARPALRFTYYRLARARSAVHRDLLASLDRSFGSWHTLKAERREAARRVRERAADPCR